MPKVDKDLKLTLSRDMPGYGKPTWTDAWELWLAFIVAAPYPQQVQGWNMLQIAASRAARVDRSSRVQWPYAFHHLTPEAVMAVIEELG